MQNTLVVSSLRDKHIKITLRGNKKKQEFFHHLLGDWDRDWPFRQTTSLTCKICFGGVWKSPRFTPSQLRNLAKQIDEMPGGHLKLKVKSFTPAKDCMDVAIAQKMSDQGLA